MKATKHCIGLWCICSILLFFPQPVVAEEPPAHRALDNMSIEELLNIEISSAARKPQEQRAVSAAVFVITREDIAHSTATTIPELLRMAPGVNVAQIDSSKWSVTIRGFSGRLADKLLVLVDGRSVYSTTFSGTNWEELGYPLELIERIEIIRGPGGANWGANAVNGIINIITRRAHTLEGGLLSLTYGTDTDGALSALYGTPLSHDRHFLFYLREFRSNGGGLTGQWVHDDDVWRATRVGGRMEWDRGDDQLSLELTGLDSRIHDTYRLSPFRPPFRRYVSDHTSNQEFTAMGQWEHTLSDESEVQVRANFRSYDSASLIVNEVRTSGEFDFQHRFRLSPRQELVWGAGVRYTEDHLSGQIVAQFDPDRRRYRTFSAFAQDEISFLDGALRLTLGTKIEHNDYTGLELQPTARLAWQPSEQTTWWAAVTRAVGTPSRTEADVYSPVYSFPGIEVALQGNKDFDSETVVTIEGGLRRKLSEELSADITIFYSDYDKFRATVLKAPFLYLQLAPPRLVAPVVVTNDSGAVTKGIEIVLDWQPHRRWHTRLMWSYLEINVQPHTNLIDILTPTLADDTPAHQLNWQQRILLSEQLQLDIDFRYVDRLKSLDIDAYATVDLRLGWMPRNDLEIEVSVRNLLQPEHTELTPTIINTLPSRVERGVYAQVTWEF